MKQTLEEGSWEVKRVVVVRAGRQVLSGGLCKAQLVASLPVSHCRGGHVTCVGQGSKCGAWGKHAGFDPVRKHKL